MKSKGIQDKQELEVSMRELYIPSLQAIKIWKCQIDIEVP